MARKARPTYRQRKARKEALQVAALAAASLAALPVVVLAGAVYGDVMAGTAYAPRLLQAIVGLFA